MEPHLHLDWASGRIDFGPSGPAAITVRGPGIDARAPELWVQPYSYTDIAPVPDRLLTFKRTTVDPDKVVMTVDDVAAVNGVDARWVLALDGHGVAGGYCRGSIEGSNDTIDTITVTDAQGTIELTVIDVDLSGPGGGVQSIGQGANVHVDTTDSANPVVSADVGIGDIPTTPAEVGADPAGTAASAVSAHNSDPSAHSTAMASKADLVAGKIPTAQLPSLTIDDVASITTPQAGDVITFDGTNWINSPASGGSLDELEVVLLAQVYGG